MAAPSRSPRWPIVVAAGLPVLLVAAVLVASVVVRSQGPGPLALGAVPAPEAGSRQCAEVLAALPAEIEGRGERRALVAPVPSGAGAWGEPPVVLRCGIGRPAELTPTTRLLDVSGVQFLEIPGAGATSWVVVDRAVYVAVTLPPGAGSAALQQVGAAVAATLPRRPVDA